MNLIIAFGIYTDSQQRVVGKSLRCGGILQNQMLITTERGDAEYSLWPSINPAVIDFGTIGRPTDVGKITVLSVMREHPPVTGTGIHDGDLRQLTNHCLKRNEIPVR